MSVVGRVVPLVVATVVSVAAFDRAPDPRTIEQALSIGLSRIDADRAGFHRPYRLEVNRSPVDWVDIVTPFRRIVLEAEARTRNGARLYGQREAVETLAAAPDRVDAIVELTFHPLNTFIGVPGYDVRLVTGRDVIAARETERIPRFGPRLGVSPLPYPWIGSARVPRGGEPLLGGVIVAQFDGRLLAPDGGYDVVIEESGKELARARVELGRLR